jgi:PEGA domain
VTRRETKLLNQTPLTVDGVPVGTRHAIRVELPGYTPFRQDVDMSRTGAEVSVMARLAAITGKIKANSVPQGAEVWVNGQPRGRTPAMINDVDIDSIYRVELRHKEYRPVVKDKKDLVWSPEGTLNIYEKLVR